MSVLILQDRGSHWWTPSGSAGPSWHPSALLSVTLITALAAATGYRLVNALPRPTASAAIERPAQIDLTVDRHLKTPKMLAIKWDPNSSILRDAEKAMLVVEDGNRESRFKLNRQLLEKGNLRYARGTSSVKIVMEVSAPTGQTARGVLTVIDPSR